MSCNCKTKNTVETQGKNSFVELSFKQKINTILYYFAKFIGFLFGVLLLPVINIAIVWFMFNTIVLTKEFDIKQIVFKIMGKSLDGDNDDDDYDDDDINDLTENEVVMLDVEDITDTINK